MPSDHVAQVQPAGSGSASTAAVRMPGEPLEVLPEEREDLVLADALARLGAGVHVGHQRERGVALAHLAGELRLGGAGHVDQVPALRGVVLRLRAGGEARPLDDDHRAAAAHVGVGRAASAAETPGQ